MAKNKINTFKVGPGMTFEVIDRDGNAFPFGAVCIEDQNKDDLWLLPKNYEEAVNLAIALRVASRFFDNSAKAGPAGLY